MTSRAPGSAGIEATTHVASTRWIRNPPLWIFLGCLTLYSVNGRSIAEVDCDVAPYAAWSLVQHGTFDVSAYPVTSGLVGSVVVRTSDGKLVSKYPPGSTLAAVPFVAPFAMLRVDPLEKRSRMRRLGKHIASIYVAASIVLIYLLCSRLAPSAAVPTTLLAAFGTTLWSTASQGYWAHGPAVFFLALALYLLLRSREGPKLGAVAIAGLALGMAMLIRPTTGLFALASILSLAIHRRWAGGILLSAIVSVMAGLLVSYNHHYFGNWLAGGYLAEIDSWSTPLRVGLPGLLIAPSRGLFVYSPALLLLPFAFNPLRRSGRLTSQTSGTILAWFITAVVTLFVYARWHVWWGGWCFGPRFLTETIPILAILFALAFERLDRRWGSYGRRLAWVLITVSVSIHFIGVFGYHVDWMFSHEAADMFRIGDTQIAARIRVLLWERPVSLAIPIVAVIGMLLYRRSGIGGPTELRLR